MRAVNLFYLGSSIFMFVWMDHLLVVQCKRTYYNSIGLIYNRNCWSK